MEKGATAAFSYEHYINRELSWLEFNQRVLDEALSPTNPPFERMRFLAIAFSNLDEFFMVRVATLWEQVDAGINRLDIAGMTPRQQLAAITARVRVMMEGMYEVLRKEVLPVLGRAGIHILAMKNLSPDQKKYVDRYFEEQVYPVLTPMAVDSRRPFPLILNRSLNLGLLIDEGEWAEPSFATVQVPSGLSRVIPIPGEGTCFVLLEHVIARNIDKLFPGRKVMCTHAYRITRNADLPLDEYDTADLLEEMEKKLHQRRWGFAVRLEIDSRADRRLVKVLEDALELEGGDAYPINGPINPDFLDILYKLPGCEHLKYPPYYPSQIELGEEESMFDRIRSGDLLLYHPYDSFDSVVRFVRQAARDPRVLAIKQTLYRVSGDSPIIGALVEAAEAGKQVTVLLELKARFDEANNIHWSRRLERAGAHVIYGMAGLKTHSKITLVVRNEDGDICRYVHLGTGNYNDVTARIYTDHGLFTCDPVMGADASAFFNMLTGYSDMPAMNKLSCAPEGMRDTFMRLIEREAENARAGNKAEIFAKMNSLVDEGIIAALYRASEAGVRIRLIVRGICCLRPGIEGVSQNIEVRSIVGRYLEHSRIYLFHNGGEPELYLSSADWMTRNLDRRVELLFPVEQQALRDKAWQVLKMQWKDNVKARKLESDGTYYPVSGGDAKPFNNQEELMRLHGEERKG